MQNNAIKSALTADRLIKHECICLHTAGEAAISYLAFPWGWIKTVCKTIIFSYKLLR